MVCYLRILTSGYLQLNEEFFQAFIEGGLTVQQYCNKVSGHTVFESAILLHTLNKEPFNLSA